MWTSISRGLWCPKVLGRRTGRRVRSAQCGAAQAFQRSGQCWLASRPRACWPALRPRRRSEPFTADGQPDPTLRIAKRYENVDCDGGSAVTARVDAWRCASGNLVMDPCFESPSQPIAVCRSIRTAAGSGSLRTRRSFVRTRTRTIARPSGPSGPPDGHALRAPVRETGFVAAWRTTSAGLTIGSGPGALSTASAKPGAHWSAAPNTQRPGVGATSPSPGGDSPHRPAPDTVTRAAASLAGRR